ncbi:MAG: hypothetical protein RBR97_20225 [Bacteroidales bacterium]|nr:hypothetical protein [Bacteroidales bacterium]
MKQILIILAVALTGCATLNTHSSERTLLKQDFSKDAKEIYRIAMQTAMELNWEITMNDSETLAFSAKTPKTMSRWDDVVNVFVVQNENISTMTVKSGLGHKPNVDYINSFIDTIKNKAN